MRPVIVALALAGFGGAGLVSGTASEALSEPTVTLTLHVDTDDAEGVLQAQAVVTNTGSLPVFYYDGCGCGVLLTVQDAEGTPLRLSCGPIPLCPCAEVELPPGETLTASIEFHGEACNGELEFEPVPSGEYEVVASFRYTTDNWRGSGQYRDLRESHRFVWPLDLGTTWGRLKTKYVL